MIRTGLMKILMWTIIPIAFTLIFFVTADLDNGGVWINLAFVWISYLTASAFCLSKLGKQLSVLNWTMYYCAVVYFTVELVAAILFLYVYPEYHKLSFTIQLLLLVVFLVVFGFSYISNQKTEVQMQEFFENDSRVKQWRAKVALMLLNNPSKELKELSALLNVTPIMSTQEVCPLDDEIAILLESDIKDVNLIINKVKERNIILKYRIV